MNTIKPLYRYNQTPMTEEQSLTFVNLCMMEGKASAEVDDLHKELMSKFGAYPIMAKRLEHVGAKATIPLLVFCSTLCETPGEAVMYAHAIACIGKVTGSEVTFMDFVTKFPTGFPDKAEMSKAWDAQKGPSGENMLDRPDLYPWEE